MRFIGTILLTVLSLCLVFVPQNPEWLKNIFGAAPIFIWIILIVGVVCNSIIFIGFIFGVLKTNIQHSKYAIFLRCFDTIIIFSAGYYVLGTFFVIVFMSSMAMYHLINEVNKRDENLPGY